VDDEAAKRPRRRRTAEKPIGSQFELKRRDPPALGLRPAVPDESAHNLTDLYGTVPLHLEIVEAQDPDYVGIGEVVLAVFEGLFGGLERMNGRAAAQTIDQQDGDRADEKTVPMDDDGLEW